MEQKEIQVELFHISGDTAACHRYRSLEPCMAINNAGIKCHHFNPVGKPINTLMIMPTNVKLVLAQRLTHPFTLQFMQRVKASNPNLKIVYEQDDNLFDLHRSNPAYEYYNMRETVNTIKEFYKISDAIIVSTEPLREQLKEYIKDKPIYVVPNLINTLRFKPVEKRQKDYIEITYGGGDSHTEDFKEIYDEIRYLLGRYDNLRLKFVGFVPPFLDIPLDRYTREEWGTIDSYAKAIADTDINIAPLKKSRFNDSKSNIKMAESASCGVPAVGSKEPPYLTLPEDIFPLCKNKKDWIKHLSRLIENKEYREELGQRQRAWVLDNLSLWDKIYSRILVYAEILGFDPPPIETLNLVTPPSIPDPPPEMYHIEEDRVIETREDAMKKDFLEYMSMVNRQSCCL